MSTQSNPLTQTRRQILPYDFRLMLNGKICILKTNGQQLVVARGQVEHILQSDDLDPHRREMYEAALEVWKAAEAKQ
jgi:hypothetical protein